MVINSYRFIFKVKLSVCIISVIEHRFYNLSAWERREVYQRTFYSTLLVDLKTGHVCFKKSESIILFHVGYLFPRYYLYATSNLVFIILINKDPSQKSINRLFKNVLSFKWYFYWLLAKISFFFNTNQYQMVHTPTSQISKILKYYIYIR